MNERERSRRIGELLRESRNRESAACFARHLADVGLRHVSEESAAARRKRFFGEAGAMDATAQEFRAEALALDPTRRDPAWREDEEWSRRKRDGRLVDRAKVTTNLRHAGSAFRLSIRLALAGDLTLSAVFREIVADCLETASELDPAMASPAWEELKAEMDNIEGEVRSSYGSQI